MNLQKLTSNLQKAVSEAQGLALDFGHAEISDIHLVKALISQEDGIILPLLNHVGVGVLAFEEELNALLNKKAKILSGPAGQYASQILTKVFRLAEKEAEKLKDQYVSGEHIFLVLSKTKEVKLSDFEKFNLTFQKILESMATIRGGAIIEIPMVSHSCLRKIYPRFNP